MEASNGSGLKLNARKSKYKAVSLHENADQNVNMRVTNTSFEKFHILGSYSNG
jgi:hypothetical protein